MTLTPVRDWVALAVRRAHTSGAPAVFWLDRDRPHDAQLLAKVDAYFAPARERRAELVAHPDDVEDVMQEGARKARAVAEETMAACREACGF